MMTKTINYKRVLSLLVGTLLAVGMLVPIPTGRVQEPDSINEIVYPTGVYPTDVQNVQAAIDRGGTILLKATDASGQLTAFNFGPPRPGSGGLDLGGTVAVVGERAGATGGDTDRGKVIRNAPRAA